MSKVVFSVGHADKSSAARSPNGEIEEYGFSRTMAQLLCHRLRIMQPDCETVFLEEPRLTKKALKIEQMGPDCAVELHLNTNPNPTLRGWYPVYEVGDHLGEKLATYIELAMIDFFPNWRRTKAWVGPQSCPGPNVARPSLTIFSESSIPTVLLECGTITNAEDLEILLKMEEQILISQAVARGVREFLNS